MVFYTHFSILHFTYTFVSFYILIGYSSIHLDDNMTTWKYIYFNVTILKGVLINLLITSITGLLDFFLIIHNM